MQRSSPRPGGQTTAIRKRRIRAIETDRDKQHTPLADHRGQNNGADKTPEQVPFNADQRCRDEQEKRKVDPDRPRQKRNRPLESVVNDQPGLRLRLNEFMDPESNGGAIRNRRHTIFTAVGSCTRSMWESFFIAVPHYLIRKS
jgi:hypothetical protein